MWWEHTSSLPGGKGAAMSRQDSLDSNTPLTSNSWAGKQMVKGWRTQIREEVQPVEMLFHLGLVPLFTQF